MDLDEYQRRAQETDQRPSGDDSVVIPLLGLAGEAGTLLSEYKKRLRDGASHAEYEPLVSEELGDLLWYIANLATKFDLSLTEIAETNLAKVTDRWNSARRTDPLLFDELSPPTEQLPREVRAIFEEHRINGRWMVRVTCNGVEFGQPLTDAALVEDGYRFHDVLHLAFAAMLGWSPLVRRNLSLKRRSDSTIDETQDGGRAIVIEEAVAAHIYSYATRHAMLEGLLAVDYATLRTIRELTAPFEVSVRTAAEWQAAIIEGMRMFRLLLKHRGGLVMCDLQGRTLEFEPPAERPIN
jgi:NTP pyrophosphatase (non-canonical NTP hydrolase)